MAHVLLGVTGSVAAIVTPRLYSALVVSGHAVRVVATRAALYFFDPGQIEAIAGTTIDPGRDEAGRPAVLPSGRRAVFLDQDEWFRQTPGGSARGVYRRGDPVLHIELRKWADLLVIAPLDANTLAKLAYGLADNVLTCVYRAWDVGRPVVLAPAMNTLMWDSVATRRHLDQLAADHIPGWQPLGRAAGLDEIVEAVNTRARRLCIVAPQSKVLACGDQGVGAMADPDVIAGAVEALLDREPEERASRGPFKNRS